MLISRSETFCVINQQSLRNVWGLPCDIMIWLKMVSHPQVDNWTAWWKCTPCCRRNCQMQVFERISLHLIDILTIPCVSLIEILPLSRWLFRTGLLTLPEIMLIYWHLCVALGLNFPQKMSCWSQRCCILRLLTQLWSIILNTTITISWINHSLDNILAC